ncbi:uncharacterized protein TNCV_1058351 [Trichonephila clavipes]|nr:uncharacterized protein TNCV_1058351 [Trichonephila clavipes]
MTGRKTNLSRNTRKAKSVRRVIAHQTEEELASVNERRMNCQQRMTQIRANETAKERATRLEDARLRVRQSRSATSDELRSQKREHNRLQMAERRQQGTTYQPFNRLAFRYSPAEDYSLSRHVLISTMMIVCSYCKTLKFSSETKGLCCAVGKIKLPQLREPPEPLKTCLARYTAESKHFLSNIRKYNSCFQISSFGVEIIITHFSCQLSK